MSLIDRTEMMPQLEDGRFGATVPGDDITVTLYRRRGALALVGTGALAVAVAYAVRAAAGADAVAYLVALVLVPVAVVHLAAWWDASAPVLVADRTGLRLRDGRSWTGLPWEQTRALRLHPARLPRRDGRLSVVDGDGRTHLLSLGLVDPADLRQLPDALRALAGARTEVAVDVRGSGDEPEPATEPTPTPEPAPIPQVVMAADGGQNRRVASVLPPEPAEEKAAEEKAAEEKAAEEKAAEEERVLPEDPIIGPRLVEARSKLRLSIEDLADRTRIRPHVLDAIEIDDFSACGGDVYARGHLRALARYLGIDAEPLVADYDRRYATAPVTARRVFEAELAGPGKAIRPTSGGPRWSVLIAVVLVLALVWGVARLLVPPAPAGPGQRGADRPDAGAAADLDGILAPPAAGRFADMGERPTPTRLTLTGTVSQTSGTAAGTPVTVRSAGGDVVFRGDIAPGEVHRVAVPGPATVAAADAGAVEARVNGGPPAALGVAGKAVRTTFGG